MAICHKEEKLNEFFVSPNGRGDRSCRDRDRDRDGSLT